jgi:phosphoribosylformylglycinamidine (FGAM) synthase-like enzyme
MTAVSFIADFLTFDELQSPAKLAVADASVNVRAVAATAARRRIALSIGMSPIKLTDRVCGQASILREDMGSWMSASHFCYQLWPAFNLKVRQGKDFRDTASQFEEN